MILNAVTQQQQTVLSLLTLAREEHLPGAAGARCRVLPTLERVIVEQASYLDQKAMQLDLVCAPEQETSLPEPILHIVLSNLIGNALAHGSRDGRINITVQQARFSIANQHAAEQRSETPMAAFAKHGGSAGFGLGLAIVKRLSDRLQLELSFEQIGGETTVSFALLPSDSR